jgi:acetyl esterase
MVPDDVPEPWGQLFPRSESPLRLARTSGQGPPLHGEPDAVTLPSEDGGRVALDPDIQGMLTLLETVGRPDLSAGTPEDARRALRMITVDVRPLHSVVAVGEVDEVTIPAGSGRGRLRLRRYRPAGRRSVLRPTLVFFHGGGFVMGDLDTHDNQCRRLCHELDAVVVSVEYRLAPEHPFPAAVEDALAATRWVADRLARLGGDPDRLAVAGDSAGGNLATGVAQAWPDEVAAGRPALAAQLLLYPVVDLVDDDGKRYPSRAEYAEIGLLTGDELRWFGDHYVGDREFETTSSPAVEPTVTSPDDREAGNRAVDAVEGDVVDRRDPRLSPLYGRLEGLPPTLIVTAEVDPLRDEGEVYAAALRDAGVEVEFHRFEGLIHGFFDMAAISVTSAEAVATTCRRFRELLDRRSAVTG